MKRFLASGKSWQNTAKIFKTNIQNKIKWSSSFYKSLISFSIVIFSCYSNQPKGKQIYDISYFQQAYRLYKKSLQRRRRWGYYHQKPHSGQTNVADYVPDSWSKWRHVPGVVPIMFRGMSGGFTYFPLYLLLYSCFILAQRKGPPVCFAYRNI